jgi:hypothetical protein
MCAVLGVKQSNGTWDATILSVNHNGMDPAEAARIRKEHPGESECVKSGRVLGAIAVTRGECFLLPQELLQTQEVSIHTTIQPSETTSSSFHRLIPPVSS